MKRAFGFIFYDKLDDFPVEVQIKTIAHELAHGPFRLRHTFSEENDYTLAKNSTANLMDYTPTGTILRKYQWDYIHNPEAMIGWWVDEEEGAMAGGIVDVEFEKVIFSGDNYKEITTRFNQNSVCYFGNEGQNENIEIQFKPLFNANEEHTANKFYVKIEIHNGETNLLSEESEILTIKYEKETERYSTGNKNYSIELPDLPEYYNQITIKSFVSETEDGEWKETGSYTPIVYITLKEPIYDLDERFLYFSCNNSNGEGATLKEKVLNEIWKQFELNNGQPKGNLYLKDFDPNLSNTQIGYYLSNYMNNTQAKSLFVPNAHSGECAAFQDLFISLLEHQGIYSQRVSLSPSNSSDQFFLVKNWSFISTGSSGNSDYPFVNYPSNVVGDYVENRLTKGQYGWIGTPEVVEENGIAGQGNDNPFSDFEAHYIIKIGNVYYDPSYGKKYNSIKEWEDDPENGSIAGFYQEEEYEKADGTMSLKWIIRKNTTSTEIKEE